MPIAGLLGSIGKIKVRNWVVSMDGVGKGPVTDFGVGLNNGLPWLQFKFKVDEADHVLHGVIVDQHHQRIEFDGAEMLDPDLGFSSAIQGLRLRAIVQFKFQQGGRQVDYRFDGTAAALTDFLG